jgi:serine---pyruvate transaminase
MMKRFVLLTPGPTPLPPEVLAKLGEPILHHRTHEFGELFRDAIEGLKYVFRTKGTVLLQCGSGTSGMEAAVANILSPGDAALVASCGVFGNRWTKIAKAYGLAPAHHEEEWGRAVEPEKFRRTLEAAGKDVKAVFLTHTDTSTGVACDVRELARIVREHSDALVVVDSISGLGAQPLEADEWGLDVVVAASQKGLMNAPGLAFASVSERAWKVIDKARLPRFYWDWRTYRASLPNGETPYTPAVGLVAAQVEAFRLIREAGLENVWVRTRVLAEYTRRAVEGLGLSLFAKAPCDVLTAVQLPKDIDGEAMVKALRDRYGISIAGGQEKLKGRIVRIAHMGAILQEDVDQGLAALKKELAAAAPAVK